MVKLVEVYLNVSERTRTLLTNHLAQFEHSTVKYGELASYITYFTQTGQLDRVSYYQRLLETANGRYEFSRATLNEAVDKSSRADVRPVNFKTWLASALTG